MCFMERCFFVLFCFLSRKFALTAHVEKAMVQHLPGEACLNDKPRKAGTELAGPVGVVPCHRFGH